MGEENSSEEIMMDPRAYIIEERLRGVRRIIAVAGGKGGVGKSLIASSLALILKDTGMRTGLFDLDFTSPSTHLILGVRDLVPKEEKGLIPPDFLGMKYMSLVYFTGDSPLPLRGEGISNVILELFAITRWGELDFLILDIPPGISDTTLDIIKYIPQIRFLIITTGSILALTTAKKLIEIVRDETSIIGILENMRRESQRVERRIKSWGLDFLGSIPFDKDVENSLGNVQLLKKTEFWKALNRIVKEKFLNRI
ncbi:MAG TPA: ATP-binding protein [Candidatus Bathyarchaeota archaeon]|nr:ATP-binding protein [Candidatus Bathyarchaeota archaeon]